LKLLLALAILCSQLIATEQKQTLYQAESVLQRYELNQDDLYVFNSIQQISLSFKLPKDENVIIKPLYDKVPLELENFKKLIKKGFGVDIVWVDFGEEGLLKTNKGRDFKSKYLGYRVDSGGYHRDKKSSAILVHATQGKQTALETVAHEMVHVMQDNEPELYKLLQGANELVDQEFKTSLYTQLMIGANNANMKLSSNDLENELTSYIVQIHASNSRSFWLPILETIEEVPVGTLERIKLGTVGETVIEIFSAWARIYKKKQRLGLL